MNQSIELVQPRRKPSIFAVAVAAGGLIVGLSGTAQKVAEAVGIMPRAEAAASQGPKQKHIARIAVGTNVSMPEINPLKIVLSNEQIQTINSFNEINQQQKDFLKQVIPATIQLRQEGAPVNPAVMTAQAILESGWGNSAPNYNYFGIKADANWSGESHSSRTIEADKTGKYHPENGTFRSYPSPLDSFKDYARVIETEPWFADAIVHADDWNLYLQGLQSGGLAYATDPQYIEKISNLITTFHLDTLTSL